MSCCTSEHALCLLRLLPTHHMPPAPPDLQVQGEARRVFGPLLERAAKADRIRLVLGAMRRYEALVQVGDWLVGW